MHKPSVYNQPTRFLEKKFLICFLFFFLVESDLIMKSVFAMEDFAIGKPLYKEKLPTWFIAAKRVKRQQKLRPSLTF